jgi:GT2 family glycosyltransferase
LEDPVSADLSIIIVSWNTRELLRSCLESLDADLALHPCGKVETFVVDNASLDGSAALVRERFPQIHLIENRKNVGFARANNQALSLAQGRYVLLLNSDTIVKPGALVALLAFLDAHPQAGACGPRVLSPDGALQPSCYPILTPWREFGRLVFLDSLTSCATYPLARWGGGSPRAVEVISGCALLLRRTALEQVGFLDERYFIYTEEMDLCYRLAQARWQAYWVPQAEIIHYGGASTHQAARAMYIQLYRSKAQFHLKVGGPVRARLFRVLLALAYTPRLAFSAVVGLRSPKWAERARTYRALLAALPDM